MVGPHDLDEAPTLDAGSDERDSFDDILVKVVRGPSATPPEELAIGTVLADRFTIERVLGAGGMGTVYAARDQSLDREVAIKLHHASGGATRLRREAIAMARLAHPNVVTVFEVGELGRRPFVVMEYVTGQTLRTWLADKPRGWRETLAILSAAGEGLAAAHAAGLVHRDFKPENVLVGGDGRARVGDFGLARELDSKEDVPQPRARSEPSLAPMTQTGAVLGTPAYMAPEQFAGAPVDARTDQFAFCVTTWEALYGERPYPGSSYELVQAAIATGSIVPPPATTQVPAKLRAVLERGLAKDPADRHPSLAALLDAMRPRPVRARWIVLGGVLVAAGAAIAMIAARGDDPRVMCGRAHELTAGVWDVPRRAAVSERFASSGRVDATATFARVADRLDHHTAEWVDARIAACEATHVRGDQSPQLLDLRMRCLDRRLGELRALVDVLAAGDAAVVDQAIEATSRLGSLAVCADVTALARTVPLPDDPIARAGIDQLDRRTAELEALRSAGRYQDALPRAEQVDKEATALAYPPSRARAALVHADILRQLARNGDAEPIWLIAVHQASAARDDRAALDAWRGLIGGRADDSRLVGADELAESAIAAADRLPPDDPGHALLDESLAALRIVEGKRAEAIARATSARDWFAAHRAGSLDAADAQALLATTQEGAAEFPAALATNAGAIAALGPLVGADHPRVAKLHEARSRILSALGRFDDARTELAELVAPIERAYGRTSVRRAALEFASGEVDRKTAHYPGAAAHYGEALAIYEKVGTDANVAQALLGLGVASLEDGRVQTAHDRLTLAKQAAEHGLPSTERQLAVILLYLAGTHGASVDAERDDLERAREIRVRLYGADSIMVGQIESSLGTNATHRGDHAKAMAYLRHAIELSERALGPDALDALYAHQNLALDLLAQDRAADAIAEAERALAGFERVLPKGHPTLTAPLGLLSIAYAATGRGADGVAAAERAHALRAARHEPDSPHVELGWGMSLWITGGDHGRALTLVRHAIGELQQYGDDPATLARAQKWLAAHI